MVASQEQCAGSAELLPYLCLCISAALLLALAALFHVLRSKPQVEIRAPAQEKQSAAASTQLVSPPILKRRGTIWAKYPSWNLDLPPTPPLNTEGIEHVVEILKKFDLSPDTGFLPSPDPLQRLPGAKYLLWEQLGDDLPKLLSAGQARKILHTLPEIELDGLSSEGELRRAHLLLAMFAHAYVWGGEEPMDEIPEGIAKPLWAVAKQLEMPPCLTHSCIVLYNWRRLDSDGPITIDNMATLNNFFDGRDESWFYLITADVEAKGAPALVPLLLAMVAIQRFNRDGYVDAIGAMADYESEEEVDDETRLANYVALQLERVSEAVLETCKSLERMREGCLPYIFYHRVRPFLSAWKFNPTLPNGVIYRGVTEERQQFYGGSAAQSALTPTLDVAFGVTHEHTKSNEFLLAMRDYMPKQHRKFVEYMESTACLRPFVEAYTRQRKNAASARLLNIYNECLSLYDRFRSVHINLVAEYIVAQQHNDKAPKGFAGAAGGRGTGGTNLMEFLKPIRDNVRQGELQPSENPQNSS